MRGPRFRQAIDIVVLERRIEQSIRGGYISSEVNEMSVIVHMLDTITFKPRLYSCICLCRWCEYAVDIADVQKLPIVRIARCGDSKQLWFELIEILKMKRDCQSDTAAIC